MLVAWVNSVELLVAQCIIRSLAREGWTEEGWQLPLELDAQQGGFNCFQLCWL